ncbi:hypothetical protein AN958_05043 [Leucoagaricus sp. SymC.cos]|nr:hypothetical protein AN958_05043 [Leucoagaricus sp. SymC.cos]
MNTVNSSTGYSGFELKSSFSPHVLPLTKSISKDTPTESQVKEAINAILDDVEETKDNLLCTKTYQAHYANEVRGEELKLEEGDCVMFDMSNRQREYLGSGKGRVAKLMPRWDGPYTITKAYPETSSYTLDLPAASNIFPTFHVLRLKRSVPEDY